MFHLNSNQQKEYFSLPFKPCLTCLLSILLTKVTLSSTVSKKWNISYPSALSFLTSLTFLAFWWLIIDTVTYLFLQFSQWSRWDVFTLTLLTNTSVETQYNLCSQIYRGMFLATELQLQFQYEIIFLNWIWYTKKILFNKWIGFYFLIHNASQLIISPLRENICQWGLFLLREAFKKLCKFYYIQQKGKGVGEQKYFFKIWEIVMRT